MIAGWDPALDVLTAGDKPPPFNVTIIPSGHGAEEIDITADEKEVWVLNGEDSSISAALQRADIARRRSTASTAWGSRTASLVSE